jgi:cytochrome c-type biogenesis protein CcmH
MTITTLRSRSLTLVFSLLAYVSSVAAEQDRVPGARALESRLIAPCCWTQTLDVHESEPAAALRREIDRRLRGGETAPQIEDALALRYGERIRAVPRGQDPRSEIPLAVGLVMLVGICALVLVARRWRSASARPAVSAPDIDATQLDRALDAELTRLDP